MEEEGSDEGWEDGEYEEDGVSIPSLLPGPPYSEDIDDAQDQMEDCKVAVAAIEGSHAFSPQDIARQVEKLEEDGKGGEEDQTLHS